MSRTGAVTDQYTYDAFGNVVQATGTTPNRYRFTGEQVDDALGGMYMLRARYYQPNQGRFLTSDAYAGKPREPLSLHKYAYAHADPVDNTDPSGQFILISTAVAQQKVALPSIPGLIVTGLAITCVFRLTASALLTALDIARYGGTMHMSNLSNACTAERKEKTTCKDLQPLITCAELLARDSRYYHFSYPDAFAEAASRWRNPIKKGGAQEQPLRNNPPCAGCEHFSTREVQSGRPGPSIGKCPCCIEDSNGARETRRFAVLLP